MDEFLSDWEPEGEALPWTIGDDGWVSQREHSGVSQPSGSCRAPAAGADPPLSLSAFMAGEGISPILKVLYVPDYVPREQRVAISSRLPDVAESSDSLGHRRRAL